MQKKVNIIILNYNGLDLLKECLPTICKAAANSKNICIVTMLDNHSTDKSIEYVKSNFPEVIIHIAMSNKFLVSYNELVVKLRDDIIILLNNDIKLEKNFVDPIVEIFNKHDDAFMVGPKCWTFDMKRYEGSRTRIRFYFGFMQAFTRYPGYQKDIDTFGYSAAVGSVPAFDRKKFIELGGFDDLYLPGRVEDLDICYRGWKRGWKGYYQPKSLALHKSSAAFNDYIGKRNSCIMSYKNTFLFIWKNIMDSKLIFKHILFLLPRFFYSILSFDFMLAIGFLKALPLLPKAIKKRFDSNHNYIVDDNYVFDKVGF